MPWSGSCQTPVAHSACDWTSGHRRLGRRWLRRVCSRIESSAAPKTSFWRWSKAPFPIRTGRAPAYPVSSSRVDSFRSRRPSIPYMIWSDSSSVGSTSATKAMNSSASQVRFSMCSAWSVKVVSRIQV